nr:DUF2550 family protein [Schaalia suimastitidis]
MVFWVLLAILIPALAVWVYLNVRARRLSNEVGAFRCWSRPDTQSGWTSGVGLFGVDTLTWYRLVALSNKPVYTFPRHSLEVHSPQPHSSDGSVVEVRIAAGDERLELLIEPQSYNALVSWIESGPPSLRR